MIKYAARYGLCLALVACGAENAKPSNSQQYASHSQTHDIDASYSNNWRGPELTHASYKMQSGDRPCPAPSADLKYIDPLPVILKHARNNRLILINESHYKPLHRLFIGKLAQELSQHGYRHYGAEMLGGVNDTAWLNSREGLSGQKHISDVNKGIKTYLNEPVYAQVLEELAEQGFFFFAYEGDTVYPPEGTLDGTEYRDSLSAKNINAYLNQHPNENMLIHAGYHHIKETNQASSTKWMAEQLKALNGIDPLTLSQTDCYGGAPFEGGFLGYGLLADKNGRPIARNGYDLILIAPKAETYKERPIWLRDDMGRGFIDVPDSAKFDGPTDFTLITARRADRPSPAAPEDIIYRAPQSDKALALRPGTYHLEITDRGKQLLKTVKIDVE